MGSSSRFWESGIWSERLWNPSLPAKVTKSQQGVWKARTEAVGSAGDQNKYLSVNLMLALAPPEAESHPATFSGGKSRATFGCLADSNPPESGKHLTH